MVRYVFAATETKSGGEKTINKAAMLRLLKQKTAVSRESGGEITLRSR